MQTHHWARQSPKINTPSIGKKEDPGSTTVQPVDSPLFFKPQRKGLWVSLWFGVLRG